VKQDDAGHLRLAASDVTTFAACAHATALDLTVAAGGRPRPPFYPDAAAQLLRERGRAHEAAYLAWLRQTRDVVDLPLHAPDAAQQTLAAMQRGVDVIYQGTLERGEWFGRPDFLLRVPGPHGAMEWSYEPADAKLALTAKVQGLLQLCFYAELLTGLQGVQPRRMTLVLGDGREEMFPTSRYEAYFRWLRRRMEQAVASPAATYPEPVEHCDVCDWYGECDARWRADDHLSLVAGLGGTQRRALGLASVNKVTDLGALAPDVPVEGIGRPALARVREQARVQVRGRDAGRLVHELVPDVESGHGLSRLPLPSPGDLFVDLEGDSFALGDGIEYLFGVAERATVASGAPRYTAFWALDHASERVSFEGLMAFIAERRAAHPDMHVYHYAPYEPTAFKRLAGRYATCVEALDELLRAHVLVDLFGVVRQGIRASVESYSIKRLEPLYGFVRDVPLPVANRNLAAFSAWLERRGTPDLPTELRAAVEGYNRDDCISALRLHAWLEERRAELEAQQGAPLPRPQPESGEPPEDLSEAVARVRAVMERLLEGVPEEAEARDEAQSARFVLAHLLEWHRREDKSTHWEYFKLCELPVQELIENRTAIAGLTYEGPLVDVARSTVHRYRFPPQDQAVDRAREVHDKETRSPAGTVVLVDEAEGILDLKRAKTSKVPHPTAVIPYGIVKTDEQRASLLRLGEHVRDRGLVAILPVSSALALLRREEPLPSAGGSDAEETAILRALAVKHSVLPVQGPPGTGKTYLGARMIVALLRAGKRVGITANSHRVISRLLEEACHAARREKVALRAIQKPDGDGKDGLADPLVTHTTDNAEVRDALARGTANVAAGTSWLWSRADMAGAVDVLFVDEAGQMSLANVLASAPASSGIILLGDPQQLDQPQKGVHPPGVAASALGHILGDAATMSPERGLFLEETWRMHPDVCSYISEVFYEGRLRARSDLSRIRLDAPGTLSGTGLRFVPVQHQGNRSDSIEEAAVVANLVERLTGPGSTWTDRHGETHPLTRKDILVVAPYNAHVALLRKYVPGADIGTVDKFQGQQAPVVIYSMATSSPDDAPRGPEFLYSGNRLNVAISRARCAAFLVANPGLFELRCKTERQMALANAFCRYVEVAAVCPG
jgi:uncharacterized protein